MAEFYQVANDILADLSKIATTTDKYFQEAAQISTQTKQIQLQTDINAELKKIRNSANDEEWETQVNEFFTRVKSGMTDKNSPYYCRNNLQAKQFLPILEQNRVGVNAKVSQMAEQRQMQKDIVSVQNAKQQLSQMTFGQNYINQANELDRGLYEAGRITPEQYQQQKDLNFKKGYTEARLKTFEGSLNDAIAQGKSFEALWEDVQSVMPEMNHTDINGLTIDFDKTALDENIKKSCGQSYGAKLRDIQDTNANKLSEIVQQMKQQQTAEGRLAIARKGQLTMNGMKNLQLSENDRLKYAALFDIFTNTKGSGSGSGSGGSGGKPTESIEKLIKASPETAMQLWEEGKIGNLYDITETMSYTLKNEWFNNPVYKENYDKTEEELEKDYNMIYRAKVEQNSLTNQVLTELIKKYPTAQYYLSNNCKNLITDIQKNPKQYGEATVGELSDFMFDWIAQADPSMTDDNFKEALQKHVNDCYVDRIKYVELKDNGKLAKTFNAKSEKDIAKAAKLAQESDFVFTYGGQERWATGKKEALEAEGGVVDVLKNAVSGTLDIPESERGKVGFYYKQQKDDLSSTPVITYKNKAYEVIPTEDEKSFSLREVHTGEVIQGKIGGAALKAERKEAKLQAKEEIRSSGESTKAIENERAEYIREKASKVDTIPKAVVGAGSTTATDWQSSSATRQSFLQNAAKKIDNAAKRVKTDEDKKEFKETYGIDYDEWVKMKGQTDKYELILNS